MPNYSSNVAKECVRQFTSDLPLTGNNESALDEDDTTPQVFALTFGDEISINVKSLVGGLVVSRFAPNGAGVGFDSYTS